MRKLWHVLLLIVNLVLSVEAVWYWYKADSTQSILWLAAAIVFLRGAEEQQDQL